MKDERLKPPHPDEIKSARTKAEHTQEQAAATVHTVGRRWREWEAGDHRMPPATWELYLLRTQAIIFTEPPALQSMPAVPKPKGVEPCTPIFKL